jgi:hypothetical protein
MCNGSVKGTVLNNHLSFKEFLKKDSVNSNYCFSRDIGLNICTVFKELLI